MSTSAIIIVCYAALGASAAIVVLATKREVAGSRGAPAAFAMLFLWPFLVPLAFSGEEPISRGRDARIEAGARRLIEAWSYSGRDGTRESAVTREFLEKLRRQANRLDELESAAKRAPPAIHQKLERMIESSAREIDQGLALVEEMAGQLTLLRFAPMAFEDGGQSDREHVLDLLARIEAMTTAGGEAV